MERVSQTRQHTSPQQLHPRQVTPGYGLWRMTNRCNRKPGIHHAEDRDLQTRGPRTTSWHSPFGLLLCYSLKLNPMSVTWRDKGHSECWDLSSKKEKGSTLRCDLMDGFCKAPHIARSDTGNGNSTVLGSVDRILLLVSEAKPNIASNSPRVLAYPSALATSRYRQTYRSKRISKRKKQRA